MRLRVAKIALRDAHAGTLPPGPVLTTGSVDPRFASGGPRAQSPTTVPTTSAGHAPHDTMHGQVTAHRRVATTAGSATFCQSASQGSEALGCPHVCIKRIYVCINTAMPWRAWRKVPRQCQPPVAARCGCTNPRPRWCTMTGPLCTPAFARLTLPGTSSWHVPLRGTRLGCQAAWHSASA